MGRLSSRPISIYRLILEICRECVFLGALLPILAALVMASTAAAADLATLVANLVTGGYSDRDAAITALAASGEARAAPILQALNDGALYVRSADKVVVIAKGQRQAARADRRHHRQGRRHRDRGRSRAGQDQQPPARHHRCRDGHADLDESRSEGPARRGAGTVHPARGVVARSTRQGDGGGEGQRHQARDGAGPRFGGARLGCAEQGQDRGDRHRARPWRPRCARRPAGRRVVIRRRREGRRDRRRRFGAPVARRLGRRAERLVRHLARLGAAAGGDRARHHLRHHGRHQHGAWRDGDAGRLHDLRRAAGDAQRRAAAVRLLDHRRPAARLPGVGRGRHRDRAQHHPLPLQAAARHAARHLGPVAGAAAGGALDLRPDQPRGRVAVVDVGRLQGRPDRRHLRPALDRDLRPDRVREPAPAAAQDAARPLHARGDAEPADGRRHGHPHAAGRCADLRPRLGHRRPGRRGAQPDRQCQPEPGAGLHHRLLHGRGVRRRRQSVRHAARRDCARHRQQVPRTLCRRRAGQDPGAGVHHPVHPAPPARTVRAQGALRWRRDDALPLERHEPQRPAVRAAGAGDRHRPAAAQPADAQDQRALRAVLHPPADRQVSLLRLAGAGGRPGVGLLRHPLARPRRLLRARRLLHGHVPDAPDRHARRLRQSAAARFHGVPELSGAAVVLARLPPLLVRRADDRDRAQPAGAGAGLVRVPQPRHRRLSLDHHPGDDLRAAARLLPQRHGPGRQQRLDRLQGHPGLLGAGRQHARRAVLRLGPGAGDLPGDLGGRRELALRQGADGGARRREPHAVPRLPRRGLQALRLRAVGGDGGHRRRALRAAGRHHQSQRVRARQLDRGGAVGRRRRPRHA